MNQFFEIVAEILDVAEVQPGDELSRLANWDSLSILSLIARIDAQYGVNLTAHQINAARTARDVWELVQAKRI